MRKRLYVDLETTGLYPSKHGIAQIGALVEINGEVVESMDYKCQVFPGDVVEKEALKVHGTTAEDVRGKGSKHYRSPLEVYQELTSRLGIYVDKYTKTDKLHFVGYNCMKFDEPFLRKWFEKCTDKYFGSWFFNPSIDVMAIAAWKLQEERYKMPNFQLATVCRHLNIPVEDSRTHDAMYDIELTRNLLLALEAM